MRHRFLTMRSNHMPTNSRYVLTVLRPPSAESSHPSIPEEGEEEQELPTSDVANNKQKKND